MNPRRLAWTVVAAGTALSAWPATAAPDNSDLPQVEATIDTTRATVGDPLRLQLRLRYRPGDRPLLPAVAESLSAFAVRPGTSTGPSSAAGAVEWRVPYELRLFRTGSFRIPSLPVRFVRGAGDTAVRATAAIDLQIVPVRQPGEDELRDIKPPLDLPRGWPLWLAAAAGGLLAVGAAAWLWRRRAGRGPSVPRIPVPPVDYLAEFTRIAAMGLLERGAVKIYYSLLSDTLRRFLEEHAAVAAMEQTTAEIDAALRRARLPAEVVRDVGRFLRAADLVKFARAQPAPEVARQAPEAGKAIVRAVLAHQAALAAAAAVETSAVAPTVR